MAIGVSGYLPSYYQTNTQNESKYGGMLIRPHYVEEYNIEGNYSVVKIDYIEFSSNMFPQVVAWNFEGKISINGKEYSYGGTVNTSNYVYAKWNCSIVSDPIYHNTDGSKTINISLTYTHCGSTQVGAIWKHTGTLASATVALTNIPRASKITAPSAANIEDEITITVTRYSDSFTHTLQYAFSNLTGTIATKITNSTVKWTIPESFYAQIPNATHDTLSLSCITYSGTTVIGETIWSATVTADPERCKPTIAPVVVDSSQETLFLTGNENVLIKGYSDVTININAQAQKSATLTAVNAACGNKSIGAQTGVINDVGTGFFTISATDSRGYTTATGVTKTLIEYIKPTCNVAVAAPTTAGATTITLSGNYFNGTFGKENNILVVLFRHKANDEDWGDWQSLTVTLNGNSYTATAEVTGLDYRQAHTFQGRAYDMLETVESVEKRVKTIPVYDWSENDFNFNVPVKLSLPKSETCFYATRTDTGTSVGFGIGSGGVNHGVWSIPLKNWLIHSDGKNAYINGKTLLDTIYPVGALYLTLGSESPASFLGGTWARRTDRFLLGGGNAYEVNTTGGSSVHTLTENEMPKHRHTPNTSTAKFYTSKGSAAHEIAGMASGSSFSDNAATGGVRRDTYTGYTGGGAAHNNMPPWLAVNIWQRTA